MSSTSTNFFHRVAQDVQYLASTINVSVQRLQRPKAAGVLGGELDKAFSCLQEALPYAQSLIVDCNRAARSEQSAQKTLDRLKRAQPHLFLTEADAGNDETGVFSLHMGGRPYTQRVMFDGFTENRRMRFTPVWPSTHEDLHVRDGFSDDHFDDHGDLLLDWADMGLVGWVHDPITPEEREEIDAFYDEPLNFEKA